MDAANDTGRESHDVPVLIAGGGPVGLLLALELNYRGIEAMLVERNPATTRHPKMDITNGRSMEHFRRLGIADELRDAAVPVDHPMRVIWCTRPNGFELARFEYPSVRRTRELIRRTNDGSLPLEPGMRISQILIEPLLKRRLEEECPGIDVRYGVALESFEQDADGVTATLRETASGREQSVRAQYLAGCDGAGSRTRQTLGVELEHFRISEEVPRWAPRRRLMLGALRDLLHGVKPPSGQLYLVHFESSDREFFERFGAAWHIQVPGGATIISQNDRDTWTLHAPVRAGEDPDRTDPKEFLFEQLGRSIDCRVLVANAWSPRLAAAPSYGHGRVWLAGDSAHQVIPSGGYGMNTGVCDAAALGWALAARIHGWGGEGLLKAYDAERRPVGYRNMFASARHVAIRVDIGASMSRRVHRTGSSGRKARSRLGDHILELGNLENEALGLELGYRYDDSPVVCHEPGARAPSDDWATYTPCTWPGQRIPSVFLEDGTPLFDLLGPWFTLLRFDDVDAAPMVEAATNAGMPMEVLDIRNEAIASIYERKLVLVRPDQHVAWRGDTPPADARRIIDRVRGAAA